MANKANKNDKVYDLIIVGAGPAGLMASIYASRYRLSNLVIGKALGGELALASKVENCPGFTSIPGFKLAQKMAKQAERLGGKVLYKEVGRIEQITNSKEQKYNSKFKIFIGDKEVYHSRALVVATGSERRKLNVPGEKEYTGKGVSYCTTCDAPFYKDKVVALVGGADSACSGAIHAAEYARKIYIIYRKDKLRAEPSWVEDWGKIEASGKGETIYNTNVVQILGKQEFAKPPATSHQSPVQNVVGGVKLDKPYKDKDVLKVDGVFIEIGGVPGTSLVQPLGVKLDETGHVVVSDDMLTNVPGLFCAGDMTSKSVVFKQAIWAMAQGARAGASVYRYLKGQEAPQIKGV